MSKTSDRINLTNQFLIAMPNMADPTFSGTVVYLCDHSERGALGLVINRPTDIDLQSLFNRIPIYDMPPGLDIFGPAVLVLQIICDF